MLTAQEPRTVLRYEHGRAETRHDHVVTEEPLEIRLMHGEEERSIAVTMRTPGADEELVRGFLYAEGAIQRADDILGIEAWRDGPLTNENVVRVRLRSGFEAVRSLSRNTFTSSACGVCGTGSIEMLAVRATPAQWTAGPIRPELIATLPEQLALQQALFATTGGLHAAALFTARGQLLAVREDVGRHNTVDKIIGWALREHALPLTDHILMVSGRAGFEITQKAALAGIPVVCSVSAPTSLAISVAESFDLTLLGFLRGDRFNVYTSPSRLAL